MKRDNYITVMTTKEIKNELMKIAEKEDRTLSYIVNRILKEYINTLKKDCTG